MMRCTPQNRSVLEMDRRQRCRASNATPRKCSWIMATDPTWRKKAETDCSSRLRGGWHGVRALTQAPDQFPEAVRETFLDPAPTPPARTKLPNALSGTRSCALLDLGREGRGQSAMLTRARGESSREMLYAGGMLNKRGRNVTTDPIGAAACRVGRANPTATYAAIARTTMPCSGGGVAQAGPDRRGKATSRRSERCVACNKSRSSARRGNI